MEFTTVNFLSDDVGCVKLGLASHNQGINLHSRAAARFHT